MGVGDSLHVPTPAPDQDPGKRLPGRPGTHPRRPPGDVFGASAPAPSRAGPRLRCPPWPGASGPPRPLPAALHSARARSAPPRQLCPTHHPMDQKLKKFAFRGFARPSGNFVRGHRGGLGGSSHSLALFLFLSLFCLFFPPTLPSESCWALSHFYSSGVGRGPLQGCPDGPRPTPPPPPRLPHSCADKTEIVRRRGLRAAPRGPPAGLPASPPEQRRRAAGEPGSGAGSRSAAEADRGPREAARGGARGGGRGLRLRRQPGPGWGARRRGGQGTASSNFSPSGSRRISEALSPGTWQAKSGNIRGRSGGAEPDQASPRAGGGGCAEGRRPRAPAAVSALVRTAARRRVGCLRAQTGASVCLLRRARGAGRVRGGGVWRDLAGASQLRVRLFLGLRGCVCLCVKVRAGGDVFWEEVDRAHENRKRKMWGEARMGVLVDGWVESTRQAARRLWNGVRGGRLGADGAPGFGRANLKTPKRAGEWGSHEGAAGGWCGGSRQSSGLGGTGNRRGKS